METIEVLETVEISNSNSNKNTPPTQKTPLSRLDVNIYRLFSVLVFLVPLFFVPGFEIALESEKTLFLGIAVGIAFFMWIAARLKSGHYSFPKSSIIGAALLLLFVSFLSALFSPSLTNSLFGFTFDSGTTAFTAILFFTLLFASIVFQSERKIRVMYKALFASFLVLFVFHALRFFVGVDFLSFGVFIENSATPLGRWNDLGVFAGLIALLSLTSLEFGTNRNISTIALYGMLVIALITLVVINLSIFWIFLAVFSLIVTVYNFTVNRGESSVLKRGFATPSLVVLLISVFFVIGGASLSTIVSNMSGVSVSEVRPSWEATLTIVGETWKKDPILGSGPNRFINEWLLHKPEAVLETPFWNAHFNTGVGHLPSFAVTTGILGSITLIFFLALILYRGIRILIAEGMRVHPLTLSLFIAVLYLFTAAFFYIPGSAILFLSFFITGVFIAFCVHQGHIEKLNLTHVRDPRARFVSVLLLIVFLVGVVDWEYVSAQKMLSLYSLHKSIESVNEGENIDKAEEYLNNALSFNENDRLYRLLVEVELSKLNTLLSQENTNRDQDEIRSEFQNILGRAIRAGQRAITFDSSNYQNHLALFQVYGNVVRLNAVEGAYESALSALEAAKERNPRSPMLLLNEAQLERVAGNPDNARRALNEALSMKEDYTDAIFLLAELEIEEGNTRAAINSLEQASLLDPNNVSVFFSLGLLHYNNESYEEAIRSLRRVISLSPQYSNAKYFLALSYFEEGRVNEARIQFEEIARLNPSNELVSTILNNLDKGEHPLAGTREDAGRVNSSEPPLEESL